MALREHGEAEQALEHLRVVAAADPSSAAVHYEIGQALRQTGDLNGAIAAFDKSVALDPELREGYYALAQALKQQGASARAKAATTAPATDARFTRAQEAAERGNLDAAFTELSALLAEQPEHADAHSLIGFVLGQQGQLPSALEHLQKAVALQPASPDARYHLGSALWYSGARDRAIAELRESVTLDPGNGPAYAMLGTALREQGDLDAARAALQRAIALLPPTAAVFVDLGITYLRSGDLPKATGQIEAGLNVPPPAVPAPDYAGAIAALKSAVQKTPGDAEAHNMLGLLLGRTGADGATVAAEFREAIRLQPEYAEAHNNLGLVLIQSGDDQGGIASFREAVRLAPEYADAHANLGAALTVTDVDEAIRELEKAVELAPDSVNARFNLGVAYSASPDRGPAKAIEQLRKVIELAPTFDCAHLALGKALLQAGQVPDAVAAFKEAVRLDPKSGEANYQLGLALARAGRKEEAAPALALGRELVAAEEREQNASLDLRGGQVSPRARRGRGRDEPVPPCRGASAGLRRGAPAPRDGAREGRQHARGHRTPDGKALALNPGDALIPGRGSRRSRQRRLARLPRPPPQGRRRKRLQPQLQRQRRPHRRWRRHPRRRRSRNHHRPGSVARATAAGSTGPSPFDDPARVAEFEGYIREAKFARGRAAAGGRTCKRGRPPRGAGTRWGTASSPRQKIGEAIKSLAKSLQLISTNAEAHKILGRTLMIIGRFDAAQVEFEQAIRYKPDSAESYYNLGKLLLDSGQLGARAKGVRVGAHDRPASTSKRSTVWAWRWSRLATMRARSRGTKRPLPSTISAQGHFVSAAREPERVLQSHRRPRQGARPTRSRRSALDPQSDRALFQKGARRRARGQACTTRWTR